MKPIVIYPTDFSTCAENALKFLVPISKALDAEVKLVHGIGSPGISIPEKTPLNIFEKLETEKREANSRLKDIAKALNENKLKTSTEVIEGLLPQKLTEYIEEIQPVLIVMGTVGNNALENKLMGSLTYKLIQGCSAPVLAIPSKTDYGQFQRVIYATNFISSDVQNIGFLAKLMTGSQRIVEIVHVAQSASINAESKTQLRDLEERLNQSIEHVELKSNLLTAQEVEEGLLNLIRENRPSALALSNTKRNFWESLFNRSLTKRMIDLSDIPIIAFSSSEL